MQSMKHVQYTTSNLAIEILHFWGIYLLDFRVYMTNYRNSIYCDRSTFSISRLAETESFHIRFYVALRKKISKKTRVHVYLPGVITTVE